MIAAVLGAPSAAQAAFGVVNVSAKPKDTTAGAHSDFSLHMEFSTPSDDVKDVIVHLPPGLLGDPNAAPRCTRAQYDGDACPAATKLGTANTVASTLLGPSSSPGEVFNLVPSGSEPARLGIIFKPLGGGLGTLHSESVASVRTSDSGLDTTISDVPRTFKGIALDVQSIDVTLNGMAGSPAKPFMTNPTSCAPARTVIEARSYTNPTTPVTGEASFTPTNCEALPYAPRFTAFVTGVKPSGHPAFRTVIEQSVGEANTRSTIVTLPAILGANVNGLAGTCPKVKYDAKACSAASIVGSVKAQTPIFAQPLTGDVRIVESPGQPLPDFALELHGPIELTLKAGVALTAQGRIKTLFPTIPDVPISHLELTLKGGPKGLLTADADFCAKTVAINAAFIAHSGAKRNSTVAATPTGCRLKGSASLAGTTRAKPALTVNVTAGTNALRSVKVALPAALNAPAGRRRRAIKVSGGLAKTVGSRSLTATAGKAGVRSATIRFGAGSLALTRAVRRGARVNVVVLVKDTAGKTRRLVLRARAA